jgi:ATP-dependent RNA/DNA helicase IGHMBP2
VDEVHDHLARLSSALDQELARQRAEHEAALRLPLTERVAVGVAWPLMQSDRSEPAGRGKSTWVLRAPRDGVLHEGIEPGDPVWVGPPGRLDAFQGTCVAVDRSSVELRVQSEQDAPPRVAVSLRFDPSTFVRCKEALARAAERGGPLVEALVRGELGAAQGPVPASCAGLNEPQQQAAAQALAAERLACVHGPPGTGKTRLLAALLQALVEQGDRPWALADSNAAVDHLALAAAEQGLRVVRLGHPGRIGAAVTALSLDHQIGLHPTGEAVRVIDKELSRLRRDEGREAQRRRRELYQARDALRAEAREAVLTSAQVLACTFGSLARLAPGLPPAHTAVVDEATQAIEPAVWIAVPWVQRLVLVGDPHQLGPVVRTPGSALERSLMARLVEGGGHAPMLQVQHRMHEEIQRLVRPVYGAQYRPHPSVARHLLCELTGVAEAEATVQPTLWIDTSGAGFDEARDTATRSLYSSGEARLVARVVQGWREAGLRADQIGVIAPYSAQVARLRRETALRDVEIDTVNAFQGREKEAIVCSFVRSNPEGELGFVADPRRLTVALTRARRAWCGIGDASVLACSPAFAAVFEELTASGAWQSVWDAPWSELIDG